MEPLNIPSNIEDKPNHHHRRLIIILSIIAIIFSITFDFVYVYYYQNSDETKIDNVSGLSKEEIIKRENLQEISRINSQSPVSTSTKQSLLNDLNKLNKKTTVTNKIKK